jgi:succinate-semialdehyde dehydrogenase / glutarate-semialdehyde dehydrogenase
MTVANGYTPLYLWIDGQRFHGEGRDSNRVLNPSTGDVLAEMPHARVADLDLAVEAATRAFRTWRKVGAWERAAIFRKAAELIRERADTIARVLTLEEGKPLFESRWEVGAIADIIDWQAEEGKRIYGRVLPPRSSHGRAFVVREPVGPVAAFTPWNLPIFLTGRKIATAMAAGCTIVIKPAEETPASCLLLAEAFADAGLPGGVLNVVLGDPNLISTHLVSSESIRKISFTGSTKVGKHLARLAADGVKRITMELGGHAPVIVCNDADIDAAVGASVPNKYFNAGQICISPTRFYVQSGVHDAFVERLKTAAENLVVGDGLDTSTQMGPLANSRRMDAMDRHVADALKRGARLETGGKRTGKAGHYWNPTVLSQVPDQALVMNDEPFGPLAAIAAFDNLEDVVEQANRLPYGLAAYAFTSSASQAAMLSDELEAGLVGINTFNVAVPEGPFGGVKQSGYGSEGGTEGIDAFLVPKFVTQL